MATLYLGSKPVEHAVGVDAGSVMRILLDYVATLNSPMIVTTRLPNGSWDRHRLDPDGEITTVAPNTVLDRELPPIVLDVGTGLDEPWPWSNLKARLASRMPIIAFLLLIAVVATVLAFQLS